MRKLACLLAIAVFMLPVKSFASHAMGTDISYECLGNGQYRITVAFYRDCSGINAPASIDVSYKSSCTGTNEWTETLVLQNSVEVSPLCPDSLPFSTCSLGWLPGVQKFVYTGVIDLPASCNNWIIGFAECCRNSLISNLDNPAGYELYVYAQINYTSGICNNSPVFNSLPTPYICRNELFNYNHYAIDAEGDSLVYSMINPMEDFQSDIPYTGNFTVDYPMSTNTGTFEFDSTTGQMSLTPDSTVTTQNAVITVQVSEYRNGVLIGTTMRDMQIVVLEDCENRPPAVASSISNISGGRAIDSSTIQMCPGASLSFDMTVIDPEGHSIAMTANAATEIPGSSFTVIGNGSSVTGRFSWSPAPADTGFFAFQVTYSDNGCPLSTPQTITYVLYVFDRVVASADQVYCGDPIQLNAYGGSVFTWSPATDLSDAYIPNPVATPAVRTVYTVTSDCSRTDSVVVDRQPSYVLDAGNDTTICLNSAARLKATVDPPTYGPYTYSWSPVSSLEDPPNIPDPRAKPRIRTDYVVTTFSAGGCMKKDTVTVSISGVAPNVTAIADPSRTCFGETTQLDLTIRPPYCGAATLPCNGSPDLYDVGTGSLQTSSSYQGTPYKGLYEDERIQYLYKASELNASGITGGTITQIAFYVATKRSIIPFNNFTIKMTCTPQSDLRGGFEPSLTTVYGPVSYSTVFGWNTHVLATPYDWDGVSNLVIQVCYDNNDIFNSQNDDVLFTQTDFTSVAYSYRDGVIGCSISNADTVKYRPNTRFSVCTSSLDNAVIWWEIDTSDIGNALMSDSTIQNPTAQMFASTSYMANVSLGGCEGEDPLTIIVDTTFTVTAHPDTSLCRSQPVQLQAIPSGQPSPVYLTCGVNGTSASVSTNYQIGTGGGIGSPSNPYKGNNHDIRMQMLFKRSELERAGMQRGVFTSVAFHAAFKGSVAPFKGFTIKMGCTDLSFLGNSFVPNLPVVFNPKDVTTAAGWNVHNFDNYFDWDGSSNVIVEVCFNNNNYALDDIITYSNTPFTSVIDTSADYSTGCNLPTPRVKGSEQRPNVIFGVSPPPLATFSYQWSPSATLSSDTARNPIANPVTTTTYVVTLTDGICIAEDSVSVNFYTSFDVNVFGTNLGCNGVYDGNAVSVPIGGVQPYLFIWNTGRTISGVLTDTLYNLNAGNYQITVIDNNGCDASDSVTITVPPPLTITGIDVRNVNCPGGNSGSAQVLASGGTLPHSYLWSDGDSGAIATQLTAGTYGVTLTDAGGCTVSDSTLVMEPPPLLSSMAETPATCFKKSDGAATVTVSGGTPPYNYRWSDNQNSATATGLNAGTHLVNVTDDSNCLLVDTALVSQPDSFGIIVTTQDVSCFGGADGSASATVMGDTINYVFLWDLTPPRTTASVTGLTAGQIRLTVSDSVPCPINTIVTIGSPDKIAVSSTATGLFCYGDADGTAAVTVDSGGSQPYRYLWSNGITNPSISGLAAGEYRVTVFDANDCTEFDTISVIQPDSIIISNTVENAICFGDSNGRILVTVSGGTPSFSFNWNDGQITPIAENLSQGAYSVTVTDRNGCIDSLKNILVNEPLKILIENIGITPTCAGRPDGAISFSSTGGTGPYLFTLDDSVTQSNPAFTALPAGAHRIAVTDGNGCSADSNIIVITYDTIHVAFDTSEINLNLGEEVTLSPIIEPADPAYQIEWVPSSGLSCRDCANPVANPVETTEYVITVADEHCSYAEEIVVKVRNNLILVVPNAFTPNGDGVNDILYIHGISVSSLVFQIFDRWGEKVFETKDIGTGWDGSHKGKMLMPDVFVYFAEAVFDDGQRKQIKGSTTILK